MKEGAAFGRERIRLRRIRKKKKKKKNCFQVKNGSRSFAPAKVCSRSSGCLNSRGDGMNRAEPGLGVGRKDRCGEWACPLTEYHGPRPAAPPPAGEHE
jgi:hypothetical protein